MIGGVTNDVIHCVVSEFSTEVADTNIMIDMNGNPNIYRTCALICAVICMLSSFFSVFMFNSSESTGDFFNLEDHGGSAPTPMPEEVKPEPTTAPDPT